MEPIDYDCEDGTCPDCGDVCMTVQENIDGKINVIRYLCPACGYYADFDDSPLEGEIVLLLASWKGT